MRYETKQNYKFTTNYIHDSFTFKNPFFPSSHDYVSYFREIIAQGGFNNGETINLD